MIGAKRTAEESHQSGESPSNKKQRGGDGEDEPFGPGEGPDITLRFLIQSQVGLLSHFAFISSRLLI